MVTNQQATNDIFIALGDTTRRAIIAHLARGDAKVWEIAEPFKMSRPAISKHLRVLERAKLIRCTRVGRESHCSLQPKAFRHAVNWLEIYQSFWDGQLDALQQHFENRSIGKPGESR